MGFYEDFIAYTEYKDALDADAVQDAYDADNADRVNDFRREQNAEREIAAKRMQRLPHAEVPYVPTHPSTGTVGRGPVTVNRGSY